MDRLHGHGMVSLPILRACTWMDVPPHLPSSRCDVVRPRILPWHASLGSFRFAFLPTLGSGSWGSDPGTNPRRKGWIPTACASLSANILWDETWNSNHLACVLLADGKVAIVGDLSKHGICTCWLRGGFQRTDGSVQSERVETMHLVDRPRGMATSAWRWLGGSNRRAQLAKGTFPKSHACDGRCAWYVSHRCEPSSWLRIMSPSLLVLVSLLQRRNSLAAIDGCSLFPFLLFPRGTFLFLFAGTKGRARPGSHR